MKREFIVYELCLIDDFSNKELIALQEVKRFQYMQWAINFIKDNKSGYNQLTVLEVWS